jgi:hypothetical protein
MALNVWVPLLHVSLSVGLYYMCSPMTNCKCLFVELSVKYVVSGDKFESVWWWTLYVLSLLALSWSTVSACQVTNYMCLVMKNVCCNHVTVCSEIELACCILYAIVISKFYLRTLFREAWIWLKPHGFIWKLDFFRSKIKVWGVTIAICPTRIWSSTSFINQWTLCYAFMIKSICSVQRINFLHCLSASYKEYFPSSASEYQFTLSTLCKP